MCLLFTGWAIVHRHLSAVGDDDIHSRFIRRADFGILDLANNIHALNHVPEDDMLVVKML